MKDREKSAGLIRPSVLWVLAAVCVVAGACFGLYLASDPYDNRILPNVVIADTDVGGMTRAEARKALEATAVRLAEENMVLVLPEETISLSAESTGVELSVRKAVEAAYAYGRTGTRQERQAAYEASGTETHRIGLLAYLGLDEDAVYAALQAYAAAYDTDYSDFHYEMEGQRPSLEEGAYEEGTACQTLLLTLGTPGVKLDVERVCNQVLNAYDEGCLLVEVEEAVPEQLPDAPDLAAIYGEVCTDAVNASLDMQTYERVPAVYGYCFDLEQAQELVDAAGYGETVRVPMEIVEPEILGDEVYFQDVLGAYNSGHSDRPNIVNNLELVCSFLDGVVIQPGEVFSYNDTIGERTVERGFLYGESFSGLEEGRSAGGGVCQGSSVLYVCALTAELEIVERVNHGIEVSYTPPGQDAAVSWGGPDFRFRNNTHFPIQITAKLADSQIQIQLLGTDERDYDIELESTYGRDALQSYANVYALKYDRETGELLSREKISHSAYYLTDG